MNQWEVLSFSILAKLSVMDLIGPFERDSDRGLFSNDNKLFYPILTFRVLKLELSS